MAKGNRYFSFLTPFENDIIVLFLFLFFISPVIQLISGVNITNLLFLVTGITTVYGFLTKGLSKYHLVALVIFGAFLLFGAINGYLNHFQLRNIIYELTYYLKPFVFFYFALYFVRPIHFKRLLWLIFWGMIITIPLYIFSAPDFIDLSRVRLRNIGYEISDSAYFSGTLLKNGFVVPRNPTFLLSYLDSAYVLFFLSAFYVVTLKSLKNISKILLIIISGLLFLTTFTRSALIALPVAVLTWLFMNVKSRNIKLGIVGFCIIAGLLSLAIFYNQIVFLFFHQESASIHWVNIFDALKQLSKYPLGTGLGSSGWQGDSTSPLYMYSEGSIFTSLLELGIQFIGWYIALAVFVWNKSKKVLFPILSGYFVIALLLPIGFSTQFNLLFFVALGILSKPDSFLREPKESLYLNN